MADLVCHVGDALVAFWLFFAHLKLSTASVYTASTVLLISTFATSQKFFYKKFLNYIPAKFSNFQYLIKLILKNIYTYSWRVVDMAGSSAALREQVVQVKRTMALKKRNRFVIFIIILYIHVYYLTTSFPTMYKFHINICLTSSISFSAYSNSPLIQ